MILIVTGQRLTDGLSIVSPKLFNISPMTDIDIHEGHLCCPVCGQRSRPYVGASRRNVGALQQIISDLLHHRRLCLSCGVNFKVLRFNPLGPCRYLPRSWIRRSRTKIYGRRPSEFADGSPNLIDYAALPDYEIHPALIPVVNTLPVKLAPEMSQNETSSPAFLLEMNSRKVGLHLQFKVDGDASAEFARSALQLVANSARAISGLTQQVLRDVYGSKNRSSYPEPLAPINQDPVAPAVEKPNPVLR